MNAQVAATVKKVAAMSLLGASSDNWTEASVCAAAVLGFPAAPDTFEVSVEVDGSHIFGHKSTDQWTFMPGKDGLPGLIVPTNDLGVEDEDHAFVNKAASSWVEEGVGPEMVLSLAGLGIKLRLDAISTGLASLETIRQRRPDTDASVTAGVMLKLASHQYSDMWLGEHESISALNEVAGILENIDPATTDSIHSAIEKWL
jgi:hypothetical protein